MKNRAIDDGFKYSIHWLTNAYVKSFDTLKDVFGYVKELINYEIKDCEDGYSYLSENVRLETLKLLAIVELSIYNHMLQINL